MEKKGLSQEGLKFIACLTMLTDHVGAVFFKSSVLMRILGRIAFPIYCFLLAEGAYHTKNPAKYAVRMAISLVLSELPFDFAFYGGFTLEHQSVMFTLLIGFGAIQLMKRTDRDWVTLIIVAGSCALAVLLKTDYNGYGVLLIVLFSLAREKRWLQTIFLFMVASMMNTVGVSFGSIRIPIEMFALVAMVPISFYSGEKHTSNRAVQWVFYSFYPVHLTVIWLIQIFCR